MGPKITCKITVRKAGIHGRVGKLASRTLFDIGSDILTYIFTYIYKSQVQKKGE